MCRAGNDVKLFRFTSFDLMVEGLRVHRTRYGGCNDLDQGDAVSRAITQSSEDWRNSCWKRGSWGQELRTAYIFGTKDVRLITYPFQGKSYTVLLLAKQRIRYIEDISLSINLSLKV